MNPIDEVKKKRFQFIHHVYEATGRDVTRYVVEDEVGERLKFSASDTRTVSRYLKDEQLIRWVSQQGLISITHEGIKEVERALSEPEKSTAYFPAMNVINIGHMEGSQIQQSTVGSNQVYWGSEGDREQLARFIVQLKEKMLDLQLDGGARDELQSDVATVEVQMASARPKSGIVKECLGSIRRILEAASGDVAAAEFLRVLPSLLSRL